MLAVALAFVVACSAPSASPPSNTSTGKREVVEPPAPAPDGDCASRIEDWPPGNRDRYKFEDPATGLQGFKNATGAIAIAATYRFVYEFGPGGVAAAVDGKSPFVFIDPDGKVLAQAYSFDSGPDYFQEGLARIVANQRIGYLDDHGRIAIAPRFDEAAGFCHGTAEVVEAGRQYVIDRAGKPTPRPPERR